MSLEEISAAPRSSEGRRFTEDTRTNAIGEEALEKIFLYPTQARIKAKLHLSSLAGDHFARELDV